VVKEEGAKESETTHTPRQDGVSIIRSRLPGGEKGLKKGVGNFKPSMKKGSVDRKRGQRPCKPGGELGSSKKSRTC